MKKTLSIIIVVAVLGAIAYFASTAKAPAVDQEQAPAATDTAAAINSSVDSIELADPSTDLNALDADINAL
ncbi:MAG: hypothetical protein AAB391_03595 [Patescibacteria group bacterium]